MVQEKSENTGELYCDERVFGVKRWYIGKPKDADMRVPDVFLDSVCFICVMVSDDYGQKEYFIGTGFFVALASKFPGKHFHYLVTARHIIEDAKAAGYSEFFMRLNTDDGKSIVAFINDDWLYPENPAVDVAVIPINIKDPLVKFRTIPCENAATDAVLQEHKVGVGDELVMVGLFNQRWGHQRNIPIVRTGIIAAMPEEPFIDNDGNLYDAYLAEMRSIGGLSGSPVFVYLDAWRNFPEKREYDIHNLKWHILLVGVIRGHWDLERQDAASDTLIATQVNSEMDRLNTGIAQVTPIHEVLAIINREELMKEREEKEREYLKTIQPTKDSNLPRKQSDEGLTQEGFEDALKQASRKIPESQDKPYK